MVRVNWLSDRPGRWLSPGTLCWVNALAMEIYDRVQADNKKQAFQSTGWAMLPLKHGGSGVTSVSLSSVSHGRSAHRDTPQAEKPGAGAGRPSAQARRGGIAEQRARQDDLVGMSHSFRVHASDTPRSWVSL